MINERGVYTFNYKQPTESIPQSERSTPLSKLTESELQELVLFGKSRLRKILIKYVENKRTEIMNTILTSDKSREERLDDILRVEGAIKMDNLILNIHKNADREVKFRAKQNGKTNKKPAVK